MKSSCRSISGTLVLMVVSLTGPMSHAEEIASDEVKAAPLSTVASLPEAPADTQFQLASPEAKPDFQIESTQVKRLYVVEPAEMPELPPVEGTITLKIHNVADPGLADPLPLPAALPADETQEVDSGEVAARVAQTRIVFISATVFDDSRTLLRCGLSDSDSEITAWSNIDFNHLQGLAVFEATGGNGKSRSYALLMSHGNDNTKQRREEISVIPDGPPAFVIQTEDPDPESLVFIEDLHALYRDEGERLKELSAARQKAREERKAYLLANPPEPKDVTIHFWNRGKAASTGEGGRP